MEYLHHLPEFSVVTCKTCKYAVLPSEIDAHFGAKGGHKFNKRTRDRIDQEVAKITGLIQDEESLRQCSFPFPLPTAEPVAALGPPETDGLRCMKKVNGQGCAYICRTERGMRKHCWKEHQWKSAAKGGQPRKHNPRPAKDVPWQTGIHCQRFFKKQTKSQYFEVQMVQTGPRPTPRMASRTDQLKAAKKEMQRAFEKAEAEENRKIKETDEAKEPSPWLRRVGCIPHLAGIDRKEVREYVEPVDEKDEPHLAIMCTAFEWLIQDAQHHAVREVVGIQTLFEANRKEVDKETNMPFDSWMDITTIERYVEVRKQLLLFVFRAEDDEAEFQRPYVLTEAQQSAMQTVRDKIGAF